MLCFKDGLKAIVLAAVLGLVSNARAATITFDLQGTAGSGLLPGNEPGSITGGTGGEIGAGVTYDNVTRILDLTRVGWGSSQGFTNLGSVANNSHLHGPTLANFGNDGTGNFKQTAGVLFNLNRSSDAVTGGVFTSLITLSAAQELDLLNTKYYINIHTSSNGGGEMRGFLVPTPEPSILGLAGVGAAGLLARRRKRA